MLSLRLVCVGRRARDPLLEAAERYVERIGRFAKVEIVRVREGRLEEERDALAGKLKEREHVVALDEHGAQETSPALARRLGKWDRDGVREIAFLIGGADGLHPDLKARARWTWSLSKLTLPHRLAQVVLLEQIYRAYTILRGQPYHRD